MDVIDFRSDTATLPSPEMREAMATAELGDDVSGEDPTANLLEKMAAELLGKEDALFVSSGTMGNLVAALSQCRSGDEIIIGHNSHIYVAEAGGISTLGGISYKPVRVDERGMIDPLEIEDAIHPDDMHYAPTSMVAIENTNNPSGGTVLTPEDTEAIANVTQSRGISLHIDGARIFNAAVYLETPVKELVKHADTVSFCLSKGLACPAGSMLCGSAEIIEEARRWRKMLGGGMRQVGVLAAAGVVALDTMIGRLAEDHSNARKLALGLKDVPGISIEPDRLPTNLVFFGVDVRDQDEVVRKLERCGIKIGDRGPVWRLVTHYGISGDDIDHTLHVFREVFSEHAIR